MSIVLFAVIGAVVGTELLNGFSGGLWTGAALGALFGWMLQLQRRLQTVEREAQRIERSQIRVPEPDTTVPSGLSDTGPAAFDADAGVVFENRGQREDESPPTPRAATTLEPNLFERLLEAAKRWFVSGNVPVKVGVLLSLFGVGFLVKEAVDRSWLILPLQLRLAAVALFGIGLLAVGWRLRSSRPAYALSVQGGGVAVLYLTTYTSFALYDSLPPVPAFALLVLVTAGAGALAVLQNSRALAVFGIIGGFMAPVLTSSGSGNHVLLFSYYAILNGAVLGIAWFKAWRELNVLGFLFTFVIGSVWGYLAYRPSAFASTEPFLILFVFVYTIIPVLFASRQEPELKGFVDGTLVFGTPVLGFGLQARLVGDTEYGLAMSAAVLAGFYLGLGAYLRRTGVEFRVLTEAFFALCIVFLTIAMPLALDARWTSVAWSMQGAGMLWLGLRQDRRLALAAGIVLQLGASASYWLQPRFSGDGIAVWNGHYLGALLIALAGWFSSWVFDRMHARAEKRYGSLLAFGTTFFLAWGAAWWFGAGLVEIERFVPFRLELSSSLLFVSASVLAVMPAAKRFAWPSFNAVGLLIVPAMLLGFAASLFGQPHPFARYGWIAWPAALAAHFALLYLREQQFEPFRNLFHGIGYWLVAALLAAEAHWLVGRVAHGIWPGAATLVAVAALVLVTLEARESITWPLRIHWQTYVKTCCGGTLAVLSAATIGINLLSPGNPSPLPYVPLLNPLEIASVAVFLVLLYWNSLARETFAVAALTRKYQALVSALFGLFLITMAVARSVHHWTGVPFHPERLAESNVLQASLSIVWGLTALAGMVIGARCARRAIWLGGAILMAAVVIKLFAVELGDSGTVTRVVSFLGVGVLLLIVGYFAPVPPRAEH